MQEVNLTNRRAIFLRKTTFQHILFWILVIAYSSTIIWQTKKDFSVVVQVVFFEVLLQIGVAYSILYFLIPKLLNKNHYTLFFLCLLSIVFIAHLGFSLYLDFQVVADSDDKAFSFFQERISNGYRYVRALVSYLTPAVFLLMLDYHNKQKETAILLEQKKTNELNTLKNQLNPHFLFNTLNNLYTLAIKKSDKTADVISKLSEILDYTLYGCKDEYVALQKEVKLLQNYIALEQVRYDKRIKINFTKDFDGSIKIAPLLLLTFLENAFKHGVSQEINLATIDIDLRTVKNQIHFYIRNTKPLNNNLDSRESLGLKNIKKQLQLLYQNNYSLVISNEKDTYSVTLKIISNAI